MAHMPHADAGGRHVHSTSRNTAARLPSLMLICIGREKRSTVPLCCAVLCCAVVYETTSLRCCNNTSAARDRCSRCMLEGSVCVVHCLMRTRSQHPSHSSSDQTHSPASCRLSTWCAPWLIPSIRPARPRLPPPPPLTGVRRVTSAVAPTAPRDCSKRRRRPAQTANARRRPFIHTRRRAPSLPRPPLTSRLSPRSSSAVLRAS